MIVFWLWAFDNDISSADLIKLYSGINKKKKNRTPIPTKYQLPMQFTKDSDDSPPFQKLFQYQNVFISESLNILEMRKKKEKKDLC